METASSDHTICSTMAFELGALVTQIEYGLPQSTRTLPRSMTPTPVCCGCRKTPPNWVSTRSASS